MWGFRCRLCSVLGADAAGWGFRSRCSCLGFQVQVQGFRCLNLTLTPLCEFIGLLPYWVIDRTSLGQYPWGRTLWGRTSDRGAELPGAGRHWGNILGAERRGEERRWAGCQWVRTSWGRTSLGQFPWGSRSVGQEVLGQEVGNQ